jgi:hypothetical protein
VTPTHKRISFGLPAQQSRHFRRSASCTHMRWWPIASSWSGDTRRGRGRSWCRLALDRSRRHKLAAVSRSFFEPDHRGAAANTSASAYAYKNANELQAR